MSVLEAAAEIAAFLEEQGVSYALLGGVAIQHWGEPRTTRDVDVVVMVSYEELEDFAQKLFRRFAPRLPDALPFARRHRVLLVWASDGTSIDISLGVPGYEEEALRRAVSVSFPGLRSIRLLSAEDLIIHKCVAGRPRDVEDVKQILRRQRLALDLGHIRQWLQAFASVVEDHDVQALFEDAVRKTRTALRKEGGKR